MTYKSNQIISLFVIVEETSGGLQKTMTILRNASYLHTFKTVCKGMGFKKCKSTR